MEKLSKWFRNHYSVTEKGKVKCLDNGCYVLNAEVLKAYKKHLDDDGEDCTVSVEDIDKLVNGQKPKDEQKDRMPPRQFVYELLTKGALAKDWAISPTGLEIRCIKGGADRPEDVETLRVAIMDYIYNNKLAYGIDEIKCALKMILVDSTQATLRKVMDNITYDAKVDASGIADRFFNYLYYQYLKPFSVPYEVFVAAHKHWMWLVKRKIWNRQTKWHLMMHWYGRQGLGKTETVKQLVSPLDGFWSQTTLTELLDSTREVKRLTSNYVLNIDELAMHADDATEGGHLSKCQIDLLKSLVTAEYVDARVMGGQEQSRRRATFTCIATANSHLYDIIFDPTSMRRYFEVPCEGSAPADWTEHNKYMSGVIYVWRSIDENNDEGYISPNTEAGKILSELQRAYYPTNTTSKLWLEKYNARAGSGNIDEAYEAYRDWCKQSGNFAKAQQNFVADIKHFLPAAINDKGIINIDYDV